ncbi:MAG: glycogen-binding domain-containing protein [Candidatus Krumholzibacteriota bacterium]|nr:glycogen-binding domain-containing protein [Candidatus Krumholzibacteriota bacterium]
MDKKIVLLKAVVFLFFAVSIVLSGCAPGAGFRGMVDPGAGPEITEEGVRFSFYSTKVDRVCIAGTFNNWSSSADPLYDREGTGLWTIVLPLKRGKYEYKFVIDGDKWISDPGNNATVDDGFGGNNSVIIIGIDPGD